MGICGMALSMGEAQLYSGVPRIIGIKITPTLAQLKKRPALWFLVDRWGVEPRITMPNGSMWYYRDKWNRFTDDWHNHAKNLYEFGGWL